MDGIISAWGKILRGIKPNLSIEITRECPLRCPGCYAYGDNHLEGDVTLRSLADYKGDELVARVKALVEEHDPLHLSIIGGEPLVRFRELQQILPWLSARGVYTNLVTSAVRPIPLEWAGLDRLLIAVSIDGLQPEHDARRQPATYDRILKHIAGHQVTVHCTVTRQIAQRPGYLEDFVRFHIRFHLDRPEAVFLAYMELRNLDPANFAAIEALRRAYEDELEAILQAGIASGDFRIADTRLATRALIAMLTGVTTWYREGGPLGRDGIEQLYWEMARGAVAPPLAVAADPR